MERGQTVKQAVTFLTIILTILLTSLPLSHGESTPSYSVFSTQYVTTLMPACAPKLVQSAQRCGNTIYAACGETNELVEIYKVVDTSPPVLLHTTAQVCAVRLHCHRETGHLWWTCENQIFSIAPDGWVQQPIIQLPDINSCTWMKAYHVDAPSSSSSEVSTLADQLTLRLGCANATRLFVYDLSNWNSTVTSSNFLRSGLVGETCPTDQIMTVQQAQTSSSANLMMILPCGEVNLLMVMGNRTRSVFFGLFSCPFVSHMAYSPEADTLFMACWQGAILSAGNVSRWSLEETYRIEPRVAISGELCHFPSALTLERKRNLLYVACLAAGIIAHDFTPMLSGNDNSDQTLTREVVSSATCPSPNMIIVEQDQPNVLALCLTGFISFIPGLFSSLLPFESCRAIGDLTLDHRHGNPVIGCIQSEPAIFSFDGVTIVPLVAERDCDMPVSIEIDSRDSGMIISCPFTGALYRPPSTLGVEAPIRVLMDSDVCWYDQTDVFLDEKHDRVFMTCAESGLHQVDLSGDNYKQVVDSTRCRYVGDILIRYAPYYHILIPCRDDGVFEYSPETETFTKLLSSTVCSARAVAEGDADGIVYMACQNLGVIEYNITAQESRVIVTESECLRPAFLQAKLGRLWSETRANAQLKSDIFGIFTMWTMILRSLLTLLLFSFFSLLSSPFLCWS